MMLLGSQLTIIGMPLSLLVVLLASVRSDLVKFWPKTIKSINLTTPWASSRLPPEVKPRRIYVVVFTPLSNFWTGAMTGRLAFRKETKHIRDKVTNADTKSILGNPTADIDNVWQRILFLLTFRRERNHIHCPIIRRKIYFLIGRVAQKPFNLVRTMPCHIFSPGWWINPKAEYTRQTKGGN